MITQTLNPISNGTYQECMSAYTHWQAMSDDSNTTVIYVENNTLKTDTYNLGNPTRIGSIRKVTVNVYAGLLVVSTGTGTAFGKTALYNGSSLSYGPETNMGSSGSSYYTLTTEYALNPWTGNPWTWDEVDALQAGVALRLDSGGGYWYCVARKCWVVVESGIPTGSGQIIGLSAW